MRLALFAEGPEHTDTTDSRDSFREQWEFLLQRCGVNQPDVIEGFSKKHLVEMYTRSPLHGAPAINLGPLASDQVPLRSPLRPRAEPLDLLIARKLRDRLVELDRLIIIFDRQPRHDALRERCRRAEVFLTLHGLSASKHLPDRIRGDARALLSHYGQRPQGRGREGRLSLELLVMEPMFEAMLVADEPGVLRALGLGVRPGGWPAFGMKTLQPDQDILKRACQCADRHVKALMNDNACRNKNKWGSYILRNLPPGSPAWRHDILLRLQNLVT